jgi:hypothetical protein
MPRHASRLTVKPKKSSIADIHASFAANHLQTIQPIFERLDAMTTNLRIVVSATGFALREHYRLTKPRRDYLERTA